VPTELHSENLEIATVRLLMLSDLPHSDYFLPVRVGIVIPQMHLTVLQILKSQNSASGALDPYPA
jgi:hypothetical protein